MEPVCLSDPATDHVENFQQTGSPFQLPVNDSLHESNKLDDTERYIINDSSENEDGKFAQNDGSKHEVETNASLLIDNAADSILSDLCLETAKEIQSKTIETNGITVSSDLDDTELYSISQLNDSKCKDAELDSADNDLMTGSTAPKPYFKNSEAVVGEMEADNAEKIVADNCRHLNGNVLGDATTAEFDIADVSVDHQKTLPSSDDFSLGNVAVNDTDINENDRSSAGVISSTEGPTPIICSISDSIALSNGGKQVVDAVVADEKEFDRDQSSSMDDHIGANISTIDVLDKNSQNRSAAVSEMMPVADGNVPVVSSSSQEDTGIQLAVRPNVILENFGSLESDSSLSEVNHNGVNEARPILDKFATDTRTDEEIFKSIREPEEPDHHFRCDVEPHDSAAAILHELGYDYKAAAKRSSDWVSVLDEGRLMKRVLRPGLDGVRADYGKVATVRCCGRLADGTEIDQHESLKLVLGDADFIEAFDICIPLMEKNEVCEIVTDAQFAYGKLGRSPDVPPDAQLTYEIELLELNEETKYSTLPISERIQLSNLKRERGNYLYERKESNQAVKQYSKALQIIDDDSQIHSEDSSELQFLVDTRVKCCNNLAAAQLQLKQYDSALKSINHVLRIQPHNVKALFRKGKCLENSGDYDQALTFMRRAAKLEPDTKVIQQDLARLEKRKNEQLTSQKKMYRKMMGTDKKPDEVKAKEGSHSWLWYAFGVASTAVAVTASVAMYRRFGNL